MTLTNVHISQTSMTIENSEGMHYMKFMSLPFSELLRPPCWYYLWSRTKNTNVTYSIVVWCSRNFHEHTYTYKHTTRRCTWWYHMPNLSSYKKRI